MPLSLCHSVSLLLPWRRYVCLKERNMVLTQLSWQERQQREARRASELPGLYLRRYKKVKLSMNRIKQVLR
jgi:hypothetical protein